ncbi:MAG: arginase family protein [bacterium]
MSPFRNVVLAVAVFFISLAGSGSFSFPGNRRYFSGASIALRRLHGAYVEGKYGNVFSAASAFAENYGKSSYFPAAAWLGINSAKRTGADYGGLTDKLKKFQGYGKEYSLGNFEPAAKPPVFKSDKKFIFLGLPGVKEQMDYLVGEKILEAGDCGFAGVSQEAEFLLRYPENLLNDFLEFDAKNARVFFNGPGNYHHLSYFFVSKIRTPVTVVVFDAHTDFRETPENAFDCGSWVMELLKIENVKKVILIGIDTDKRDFYGNNSFRFPETAQIIQKGETDRVYDGRFRRISLGSLSGAPVIPTEDVYVSFDLDCLSDAFITTDWGNGNMTAEEICDIYGKIKASRRIVGVDICAIKNPPDLKSLKTLAHLVKLL